ncbi:MAG: glycosyltransferase family 39 protein [Anaerolineae bacterium]
MKNEKSQPLRLALPLLLVGFLLIASAYSLVIPLGEGPDEVSHFGYVDYVATHGRLPPPQGAAAGEVHQPPLYYLVAALSTAWVQPHNLQVIDNPDLVLYDPQTPNVLLHTRAEGWPFQGAALAWHLARLLSILMGAVTVWATWQIATALFPGRAWIAFGAAAFVALLPEFVYLSAMVNNDNLIIMLTSLAILLLCRISAAPWRTRDALLLGLVLGLALLSKLNALVVWLYAGVLLMWLARKNRAWGQAIRFGLLTFGVAIVIDLPWAVYNTIQYGDPLAWTLYLAVGTIRQTPITMADWAYIANGVYINFWGCFGGALQLHYPTALYIALGFVGLATLIGWVRLARGGFQEHSARLLLVWVALFWAISIVAYIRWAINDAGAGQVRQLLPGLPLLAVAISVGLGWLGRPHHKSVIAGWSFAAAVLAVGTLFYLNSLYLPAPTLAAPLTIRGTGTPTRFGDTLLLQAYSLDRTHIAPGETLNIQLDWESQQATREDYWVLFKLSAADETVAQQDSVPSAGRLTTDWWQPGQKLSGRHKLVIPVDTAPGTYTLSIGLHPFGKWDWLPVHGQDTLTLQEIVVTPPGQ